ncbi:MAG: hypothetical protein QXZ12_05010 [Thermoplasmata archaeon]
MIPAEVVKHNSISYPKKFKIEIDKDPFPWFILSVLFGARISEQIATNTYFLLQSEKLTTPELIIERGWDGLVSILDAGGYTRYDFKTATKLLELSENLIKAGGLVNIHENSKDFEVLVANLKNLAKGIGDVTVGIFLREMVGIWDKAKPYPSKIVKEAAKNLGIDLFSYYKDQNISYSTLENFLVKIGKDCIKENCKDCKVRTYCKNPKN